MAKTLTKDRMVFKLLVCGGRDYSDREAIWSLLDRAHAKFKLTHLIHGAARGLDVLAGEWARTNGVQEVICPANWDRFQRAAGPIRNQFMAELEPNALIAFPGGKGTQNMVEQAVRHSITVYDATKLGL